MLLANSLLVPKWATWDHFRRLEAQGLMMFGQMTAGSWIYIGTQGILQGTYETFAAAGKKHFGGTSQGARSSPRVWVAWAARSRSRRRWPARVPRIEVDPTRMQRRLETRYLDEVTTRSTKRSRASVRVEDRALSVGLLGNAAEIVPRARAARQAPTS